MTTSSTPPRPHRTAPHLATHRLHYNGLRGTLTVTGVTGSPLFITGNSAGRGGGISAVNSIATTLTQTAVTNNHSLLLLGTAGGVHRRDGTRKGSRYSTPSPSPS